MQLRNSIFHYQQPRVFRQALEEHDEVGEIILGEISGLSRYLIADDLQTQITMRPIGAEDKVPDLGRTVADLSVAFQRVVDGWISLKLRLHRGALLERLADQAEEERLWKVCP